MAESGFKQGCGALTHVPTMREMCAALAELYPARLPYADLRLGDKNGLFSEGELAALQLAEDKSFGMQYFLALYFEMYGLPEAWLQGRCG